MMDVWLDGGFDGMRIDVQCSGVVMFVRLWTERWWVYASAVTVLWYDELFGTVGDR